MANYRASDQRMLPNESLELLWLVKGASGENSGYDPHGGPKVHISDIEQCNGSHPVCDSCRRAGTSCIYERTVRPQYPGGKTL